MKKIKRTRKRKVSIPVEEKYIQVGCYVRFTKPRKKKVKNMQDGELYKIVKPKPGRFNTQMGVYVRNDAGKRLLLPFSRFTTTAAKK